MNIIGIAIFVLGLAFLLRNLGLLHFPASFWSVFYPVVIRGIGFVILAVTYEGNYFSGGPTTVYPTCEDCQIIPVVACEYIYFNAIRCDNGQSVVVAA